MYWSSSPEESGAEPCLRCSSITVLTRLSFVFSWQELRMLAHEVWAFWGVLRLEFRKSNFQGKSLQHANETKQQKSCCPELLKACQHHAMKHTAKIPALATELVVGPRAHKLCQCGPVTKPILPVQRPVCHDFESKLTSLQAFHCVEYTDQSSWPLLWAFCRCSILTLAYSLNWRISLKMWKGRSSCLWQQDNDICPWILC